MENFFSHFQIVLLISYVQAFIIQIILRQSKEEKAPASQYEFIFSRKQKNMLRNYSYL